jgi:hypothetical protein
MSSSPLSAREAIQRIQTAFSEHRRLSYAEWEEGFIGEANPAKEIGIWLHAADAYITFAGGEPDAARRKDIYRVIGACLIGARSFALTAIQENLKPTTISSVEVERIVDYYFRETG